MIDNEITENGSIESGNAVWVFVRYLLIPSSPFNFKVMMEKIAALEEKVGQKELELTRKTMKSLNSWRKLKISVTKALKILKFQSLRKKLLLCKVKAARQKKRT